MPAVRDDEDEPFGGSSSLRIFAAGRRAFVVVDSWRGPTPMGFGRA